MRYYFIRRHILLFSRRRSGRRKRKVLALPPPPGESNHNQRERQEIGLIKRFSNKGKFVDAMTKAKMSEDSAHSLYSDLYKFASDLGGTNIRIAAYVKDSAVKDHDRFCIEVGFL